MSIESVMPSSHLILCRLLLLLPLIYPSIRVFSHESVLRIRWPKCWSFSFNKDDVLKTVISKEPCAQSGSQTELSVMLETVYICAVQWGGHDPGVTFCFIFIFWLHGVFVVAPGLSWSMACGTLLGPRMEPVSPALAGGFLTTGPPGKSLKF